jgi:hypothetical protein
MSFLSHPPVVQPDRINLNNSSASTAWEQKLHASREQLRRAIATVGDKACNVEQYLRGKGGASNGDRDTPH